MRCCQARSWPSWDPELPACCCSARALEPTQPSPPTAVAQRHRQCDQQQGGRWLGPQRSVPVSSQAGWRATLQGNNNIMMSAAGRRTVLALALFWRAADAAHAAPKLVGSRRRRPTSSTCCIPPPSPNTGGRHQRHQQACLPAVYACLLATRNSCTCIHCFAASRWRAVPAASGRRWPSCCRLSASATAPASPASTKRSRLRSLTTAARWALSCIARHATCWIWWVGAPHVGEAKQIAQFGDGRQV